MLIRIEVFPQTGKGGSTDGENLKPSQTLYASPATVANHLKLLNGSNGDGSSANDNDDCDDKTIDGDNDGRGPNAGLIATIGRKGDVDILFGSDRSISRQHALLRFVAPILDVKNKRRRRSSRREGTTDNHNNGDIDSTVGCFMEPRNADERSACDESPYGMCVVLENKGKSGSYIASEDKDIENNCDEKPDDKKTDDDDSDSDATTDDEGVDTVSESAGIGTSMSERWNYETATSLSTQTGDIIVNRKNLTPSQKLPSLSNAVRCHFGKKTPIKLTKIDSDESVVLKFDDRHGNGDDYDDTNNDEVAVSGNASIFIQFGVAQLPTVKITRIPMTVVFSSGVPSQIQNSLRICGGLLQEAGTLPQKGNRITNRTTHLVAPERMAVAKQLIAWCYGIPIVSPDFLLAMRNHSALKDPFPLSSDFLAKATDRSAFWKQTHDQNLLSKHTMISVDPSSEVEQAEGLAVAAGVKVERFYDKRKKHTKAGVRSLLKRAKGFVKTSIDAASPSQQHVFLLSSKSKSKYSNTNTALLLKTLNEELLISSVNSKTLAKTITKQESMFVGLQSNKDSTRNSKNDGNKIQKSAQTIPLQTSPTNTCEFPTEKPYKQRGVQSPEWRLRKIDESKHISEPNGECELEVRKRKNRSVSGESLFHDNIVSSRGIDGNSEMNDVGEFSSQRKNIRKVDHHEEDPQEDFPDTDDPALVESRNTSHKQLSTNAFELNTNNSKNNIPAELGRADTHGWLTVAPRDDRERSRWRQRASDVHKTKTGFALEPSASTPNDPRVQVSSKTNATIYPSAGHGRLQATRHSRHNNPDLPNFKKFQKNLIPMANLSEEFVILLDVNPTQATTAPQEMSAEERELREDQRIAEALFRSEPMPSMGKKKRRVRN